MSETETKEEMTYGSWIRVNGKTDVRLFTSKVLFNNHAKQVKRTGFVHSLIKFKTDSKVGKDFIKESKELRTMGVVGLLALDGKVIE